MKRILCLVLALAALCGCGAAEKTNKETSTVYAMDTVMSLTAYAPEDYPDYTAGAGLEAAEAEIRRLEAQLSVTDEDSQIYSFNHGDGDALSIESARLAAEALFHAQVTEGAYDPTVYPLMECWGFYGETPSVPEEAALQEALGSVGYEQAEIIDRKVYLPEGFGLDLGGIAKGYTADRVLETLRNCGIETAVISLGGNVAFMGQKPDGTLWSIGIENPDKSGTYLGTLQFAGGDQHVVTSGGYERNFEEEGVTYHHILDPETGYPAESELLSVTIAAGTGAMADAFSTALFVMGLEEAIEFWKTSTWGFDMVLYDGKTLYVTPGITIETDLPVMEVTP